MAVHIYQGKEQHFKTHQCHFIAVEQNRIETISSICKYSNVDML